MHRIRLREPWQSLTSEASLRSFSRKFNAPTGLQPEQRVELVIELNPPAQLHAVVLNDEQLPLAEPCQTSNLTPGAPAVVSIAIERQLRPFNHLQLIFCPEADDQARSIDANLSTDPAFATYAQVHLAIH